MFLAKRSNGYYFVEYFDQSENRKLRVSTGTKNRVEALRFLSDFESKPAVSKLPKILLSRFWSEYVQYVGATHSPHYLSSINLSFKKLREYFGDIPLGNFSKRLVQQFISDTYQRTKYGAYMYTRTLKAAFNIAIEWEYVEENPFKKLKLPRMEKRTPKFISESELQQIISNIPRKDIGEVCFLAFHTGMRLGEIINLKWNAVDIERRMIYVKNTEDFATKSKKDRVIPINKKLYEMLEERLSMNCTDDYVFRKCIGVKLSSDWISQSFKKAVKSCRMDDKIHFHTLRHSFASNLVQKGASIYVVKELLGHSDIQTTQIYAHLQKENLVQAVELLDL